MGDRGALKEQHAVFAHELSLARYWGISKRTTGLIDMDASFWVDAQAEFA